MPESILLPLSPGAAGLAASQSVGGSDDAARAGREVGLRLAARNFEAVFLAEMLRHAGLGRPPAGFNGGAGEAAFAGTLVEEYARVIATAGGIGLAEQIYRRLSRESAE